VLLVLALTASLHGPAPGSSSPGPARAALALSLGLGVLAGAALSATGYCAVLAARQVVTRPKGMLLGAGALVLGYALVFVLAGTWRAGFEGQPIAHKDAAWSALSMALVGLTGVLAGGCPVRQLVMTGEGNGDALVTSLGILLGGGVAHGLGLASSTSGATPGGKAVVVLGLLWAIAYGVGMLPGAATPSRAGTPVGGA
jgi:YedE family putative selenium metabolism protein